MLISCVVTLNGCQSPPANATIPARVEKVLSGQLIEVTLFNQQPPIRRQVRLQGIDAPDRQQAPWGQSSREKLTALIEKDNPQKLVQLELQELNPDQPDQFDISPGGQSQRLTVSVWHKQVLLNLELVQGGYALAQLPREIEDSNLNKHQAELLQAQDQARVMGIGIWDSAQPLRLTPAEFRRYQQNPQKVPQK